MENNRYKKILILFQQITLIISIIGIILGGLSLFYFQRVLPDAIIRDIEFETNDFTIEAIVYEPNHGLLKDSSENQEDVKRPLAVLVHGISMSKIFMVSIQIELSRRGVSSISISMPGHGLSEGPYQFTNVSTYAVSDAIDWMLDNATYPIDETRIAAVGHSMGGMSVIKAASFDSRINTTVALAAPNGDSPLFKYNDNYNMHYLEETIDSYCSLTSPRNFLYIVGNIDELVYQNDALSIMGHAIGLDSSLNPDLLVDFDDGSVGYNYSNDFINGQARLLKIYPLMEHVTESFDDRSISATIDWIAQSFLLSPEAFSEDLNLVSFTRFILLFVGVFSSLILIFPLTGYMKKILYSERFVQKYNESYKIELNNTLTDENEKEKINVDGQKSKNPYKEISKYALYYFIVGGLITGIINLIFKFRLPFPASMLVNSSVPIFLVSGISIIILLFVGSKLNFIRINNKNLFRIPGFKINGNKQSSGINLIKYLIFILVSTFIPIFLIQGFLSAGLFNVWIASNRLISFIISICFLLPLTITDAIYFYRPIYALLSTRNKPFLAQILLFAFSSVIKSITLSFAIVMSIGSPFGLNFFGGLMFWFGILIVVFLLTIPISCRLYFMDGTIYSGAIVTAYVVALVLNVAFPIAI